MKQKSAVCLHFTSARVTLAESQQALKTAGEYTRQLAISYFFNLKSQLFVYIHSGRNNLQQIVLGPQKLLLS